MSRNVLWMAGATLALSALGCQHRGEKAGSEMPNTPARESRSAVREIADARCDREERCENVGDGRDFPARGDCVDKVKSDWAGDLNAYECPNGIVDAELEECLTAIRAEECGSPLDTLQRVTACSSADICAD